jgi:23S rRNA (uracil1939-C5)-methyltransferase
LAVGADGAPAYHRRHSRQLIGVQRCLVAHPRLRDLIDQSRFPGLRNVVLRVGVAGGERIAVVGDTDKAGWRVPKDCVVVRGREPGFVHEQVAGRRWRVSARAFFQAGPSGAELLIAAVEEAVGPYVGGRVVDAYAGVGILGGALVARHGGSLIAVESHREAAADAEANLADLDAKVVRAEVGAWRAPAGYRGADVIVADPARPGLGRPGMGRDTALLAGAGYRLADVAVVDLFPHTAHVETVARFERVRSVLSGP